MSRTTMPEVCPICMEPAREPLSAACGHTFCESCIETLGQYATSCPMCRRPMVENETKIKVVVYNLFVVILSFLLISVTHLQLEKYCVTKFTGRKEVGHVFYMSLMICTNLTFLGKTNTKDFASRVHAKQRGLTEGRLQWVYLLFICTGLAICFVPSFAYWWSATAIIGLVLILPWDVCICFSAFLLGVSCALPLTLKFTTTTVLSVLTEVPVLCAIPPFLVDIIVATVFVLITCVVHRYTYWIAIFYGYNVCGIDLSPVSIVKDLACRVCMWACQKYIHLCEYMLRTRGLSSKYTIEIRSRIEEFQAFVDEFTLILNV
jgi:hypothetical protein